MSISLDVDTKSKLDRLAQQRRETTSELASQAIKDFVERELAIVAGIQRGLADMEAGRVTPHRDAMARIKKTIEYAKSGT